MTDPTDVRPPVDPLSDLSWARIERELWTRVDDAPRAAPAPARRRTAIGIGLGLAAAAALVFVLVRRPDEAPAVVIDDAPSRVVSGDSPSAISFADAHVELAAQTAVVLARQADHPTALVERGAAWFAVAPRGDRPPFVVLAGDTTVRVIGTRFRVARDGERADVEVEHGLVQVEFRGTRVQVGAHQHWSSEAPAIVAAIAPPLPPAAPPAPPAPRGEFERLTALEARDPAAALGGYLALAATAGPWAEVALFAAGRLAADRGDRRAETLLTQYVQRFPRGANRVDADHLLAHLRGAH